MKHISWLFALPLLTAPLTDATAQMPAAPRELGMGGAYLGVARGYETIFLNPANLGLADAPRWSVGFPQLALGGGLAGFGTGDLRDLVNYRDLTPERQNELLSLVPSDGAGGQFALRAPLAAISKGGLGVGIGFSSTGRHTLSRDLTELLIKGYEEGRTEYSVGNTFGERATYWDLVAGYGRGFGALSLGVSAHLIRGGTLVRTRLFEPRVDLAAQNVEVDYAGVISRGGTGHSLDVGMAYQSSPRMTISLAVSNVLASMDWSKDLSFRELTLDRQLIENATPVDLRNRYQYSEIPFDAEGATPAVQQQAEDLFEGASFPTVARFGLVWSAAPKTHFAADYHRKLSDGKLADAWDRRISLGVEQSLWFLDLRAGYAFGDQGANLAAGGLSIGPIHFGVARYRDHEVDGEPTRGWIGSFGLGAAQPF